VLARHKLIFSRKTTIKGIKNISAEDGGNWAAAWPRTTAAVTAKVMAVAGVAGVVAATVVVAEEMANAKQTVEAEAKTQQSAIKKQKNGAKTTAEEVWRLSAEDGNAVMVAVAAKATAENDGVTGRRGGRGDCSDSCRGVLR